MSYSARPLRITVVSPEMAVLHDLSWMLSAVGYTVVTSKDLGERAAWRRFTDADFIIFDGRSISSPTAATLAHHSDNPIYRFVLYNPTSASNLTAWFAAGADDALRVPLSRGELLARTRTGARVLEFQRRLRLGSSKSRMLGMNSARGFVRHLKRLQSAGRLDNAEHSLLTITIDLLAGVRRHEGELAADGLLAKLANAIQNCASENTLLTYAGNGVFHIALLGRMPAAARMIAEQLTKNFRDAQTDRDSAPKHSLSIAVVPWNCQTSPEQLLSQAQETLAIALQSGGDITIEQNTFAAALSAWQNELNVGSPFSNVVAQDIMEPFPGAIEREPLNRPMFAAFRRSGMPIWPFVNREGRLMGVVTPESSDDAGQCDEHGEEDLELSKPVTIAHNATFSEIYEAFSTHGCLEMVVVVGDRPIGYITFGGFISLIEPIDSATFARGEPDFHDSRSLLVAPLINGPERASEIHA